MIEARKKIKTTERNFIRSRTEHRKKKDNKEQECNTNRQKKMTLPFLQGSSDFDRKKKALTPILLLLCELGFTSFVKC